MARRTGGPAFPTDHSRDERYTNIQGGMTLREWYAGKCAAALAGQVLTYVEGDDEAAITGRALKVIGLIPAVAFRVADALLAHEAAERETDGKAGA